METIRTEAIRKRFEQVVALDGVSLQVEAGELFFLLGPSGCGKSTLLRCIAGLEMPDCGTIRFGNQDVTQMPPHQRGTAMVFQNYALWPHLTVFQNVAFGLEERRVPRSEVKRRVEDALELVQLHGFGPRSIDQMSGGQQQRVALARALVVKPKCLLLDEPLSNLDARLRIEMRYEIRKLVKANGLTAIYVTHDQEEALAMADRIAILTAGKVAQIGTAEEIYRSPQSSAVAAFIGETNLMDGEILAVQERIATVATAVGVLTGRLADRDWQPTAGMLVELSIRPEAWRLNQESGDNAAVGNIIERSYLGQRIQYRIATAGGIQQVVEMNPHWLHQPGEEPIQLHVLTEDVVIVKK